MAALELRCWGGGWGLPSVHADSLVVLAYAKFSGAKVTVSPIDLTWKTFTATVPELLCGDAALHQPAQILSFLRKQRFNADYELTARQGADTMAYIALLEEKLRPALLHTFWVDAENYVGLTRPWFASRSPFPLNFLVPSRQARAALTRILLTRGEAPLHRLAEVEGKIYSDAKECLNLLSYRLGEESYFFGSSPSSLDAFVFGLLAPLLRASLPSGPLQKHLQQLPNLTHFCDNILATFFSPSQPGPATPVQETKDANLQKLTQLVNKESNLIEKMDDNLRSSPQHRPRRPDHKPRPAADKSSTPA